MSEWLRPRRKPGVPSDDGRWHQIIGEDDRTYRLACSPQHRPPQDKWRPFDTHHFDSLPPRDVTCAGCLRHIEGSPS